MQVQVVRGLPGRQTGEHPDPAEEEAVVNQGNPNTVPAIVAMSLLFGAPVAFIIIAAAVSWWWLIPAALSAGLGIVSLYRKANPQ